MWWQNFVRWWCKSFAHYVVPGNTAFKNQFIRYNNGVPGHYCHWSRKKKNEVMIVIFKLNNLEQFLKILPYRFLGKSTSSSLENLEWIAKYVVLSWKNTLTFKLRRTSDWNRFWETKTCSSPLWIFLFLSHMTTSTMIEPVHWMTSSALPVRHLMTIPAFNLGPVRSPFARIAIVISFWTIVRLSKSQANLPANSNSAFVMIFSLNLSSFDPTDRKLSAVCSMLNYFRNLPFITSFLSHRLFVYFFIVCITLFLS